LVVGSPRGIEDSSRQSDIAAEKPQLPQFAAFCRRKIKFGSNSRRFLNRTFILSAEAIPRPARPAKMGAKGKDKIMVAIADITQNETGAKLVIEGHPASRVLNGFIGAVLLFAAVGLWLVPGSNWDAGLMLVKLGLSGFFVGGGLMFLLSTRRSIHPEVFLDGKRGRMRMLERDTHGRIASEVEVDYDDLSEIDFRDGMLIARDHHGQPVLEMPVEQVGNLDDVRAALGPAFSRAA
jgi:hypothetical protein